MATNITITSMSREYKTPLIRQMYQPPTHHSNCLPSADPKKSGQFVDWGTRMYELEFELQKRNREIETLKKKINNNIYQEQTRLRNNNKENSKQISKPRHKNFREKCLKLEQKLLLKTEEVKWEKEKSRNMAVEINKLKSSLKTYKIKKTTANKQCQTNKMNTRSQQTQPERSFLPAKRTISTQYMTPTVTVKVNQPLRNDDVYYDDLTHEEPPVFVEDKNTKANEEQVYERGENVNEEKIEYATAVNIKAARKNSHEDPLEMSFIQKFGAGKVQTLVKSNEKFQITEKALAVPTAEQINKAIEALQNNKSSSHMKAYTPNMSPHDSGVSSAFDLSRPQSAEKNFQSQQQLATLPAPSSGTRRITFPQRSQQNRLSPFHGYGKQAFENTVPRYINHPQHRVKIPQESHQYNHPSTPQRYRPCSAVSSTQHMCVPSSQQRPTSARNDDVVMTYPFLQRVLDTPRHNSEDHNNGDDGEKPVYLHTSEIQLYTANCPT